jgi:ribosomal protein L32
MERVDPKAKPTLIFYGKTQTVSMPCRKCGKVMFRHRSMMKRHVVCFDCKMERQKQRLKEAKQSPRINTAV